MMKIIVSQNEMARAMICEVEYALHIAKRRRMSKIRHEALISILKNTIAFLSEVQQRRNDV
jgi:hypothetical protein